MNVIQIAGDVLAGGLSQKVVVSATSAQSTALTAPASWPAGMPYRAIVTCDVPCWVRAGANPTALADGTDHYLPANTPFRVEFASGQKLALIAGGAGNAYITPGA